MAGPRPPTRCHLVVVLDLSLILKWIQEFFRDFCCCCSHEKSQIYHRSQNIPEKANKLFRGGGGIFSVWVDPNGLKTTGISQYSWIQIFRSIMGIMAASHFKKCISRNQQTLQAKRSLVQLALSLQNTSSSVLTPRNWLGDISIK